MRQTSCLQPSIESGARAKSRKARRTAAISAAALSAAAGFASLSRLADGATYTHTNAAGPLNSSTYWSSGGPPTSTDIGLFNNIITATETDSVGGAYAIGELQLTNPGGAIVITDTSNTLTIDGVSNGTTPIGIDLSTSTQNLTINSALALGGAQTWIAGASRTLTIGSTSVNAGANLLTISGSGATTFGSQNTSSGISSSVGITKVGSGTLTIYGATTNLDNIGSGTLTADGGITNLYAYSTATATTASVLNSSANLSLGGGALLYTFPATGVDQNLGALTLTPGESVVFSNRSGSFNSYIDFTGTITRNIGATLTARELDTTREQTLFGGVGANSLITSNGTAYVTLGDPPSGTTYDNFYNWAEINAAHQLADVTYTSTTTASLGTSAQNANVAVPATTLTGATTDASFRDSANQATVIDLHGNTWTTGGILVTSTVATAGSGIKDTVGGGSLLGPAGSDLTFMVSANAVTPVPFTVSANIADNVSGGVGSAVTKGAPGTLVLSGNNSFTNGVYINDGVIQLGSTGALNSTTPNAINFDGSGMVSGVANTGGGATGGTLNSAPTLAIGGNSVAVASLSSANDQSGLSPIVENANGASVANATLTVAPSGTSTYTGLVQDGTGGGALAVTMKGSGTQVLGGTLSYSGATTVNGGTLKFGSSVPASSVFAVAGGATLDVSAVAAGISLPAGKSLSTTAANATTAIVNGLVTLSGGAVTTGAVGSILQTTSFTLTSGAAGFSINDPTLTTGNSSLISETASNGLTLNGGVLSLNGGSFTSGNTYNITYNLFQFAGSVQGTGTTSLSVAAGSQVNGLTYTFGTAGQDVTLTIAGTPLATSNWITDGGGSWPVTGNWDQGVPNSQGATANFGGAAPTHNNLARTVTLDGNETVGVIAFSSPNGESYTIDQGSGGNLILDNGSSSATISATGTHLIDSTVPVNLNSNLTIATTNSGDQLTVAGTISNTNTNTLAATLTKAGFGTLVLSSANTYGPAAAGTVGTYLNSGTIKVLNGSALGAGDVSVGGTATLQSGAAALTLANNIAVAGGITATLGTGGNVFTLPGIISGNTGAIAVASVTPGGTLILTGANTYGGGTTINSGVTLQIGNNTPFTALPSTGAVSDNGSLVFELSDLAVDTVSNAISGTGSLTQNSAVGNTLKLSASNSYSGGTQITAGVVQLGNANGLGSGDVNITTGAQVDLNGLSPTIGALNGAGSIDSSTAGTMALSIGNNGDTGTLTGPIKNTDGTINLTKNGAGTQTLSATNTYTGSTTVNAGTLLLSATGVIGGGATQAAFTLGDNGNATVNGGTLVVSSITTNSNGGSTFTLANSGSISDAGVLAVDNDNGDNGGLVVLNSGTLNANSVTLGRSGLNNGTTIQTAGSTGNGIYVNGAALTITTTLNLGASGNATSSTNVREDSGTITVGGQTTISVNNTRYAVLDVSGGVFMSTDATTNGIQIGGEYADPYAELLVRGTGVVTANKITFGDGIQTSGTDLAELLGGSLYVGSGGMATGGSGAFTSTINLGGTAYTTAPILAATANWSSSLGMTLTNSLTSATPPIVQTANASGTAENITLSGVLSGTGGLTKTGAGVLTLSNSGSNTYGGGTTVNQGTLTATGTGGLGTGFVTVNPTLVTGAATDNAALNTNGSIASTAAVTVNSQALTADGGFGVGTIYFNSNTPVIGSLAGSGNVVLNNSGGTGLTTGNATNTTFSGVISGLGTGNGSLTVAGTGTFTLTGANTYFGSTTINSGATLALGNGIADGIVANTSGISDNGSLIYNLSTGNRAPAYSNGITGNGSLTLVSANNYALTFNSGNSYNGGTTVTSGQLYVNSSSSGTGNGAVAINGGLLGGSGLIAGTVNINNTSTLRPGLAAANGILTDTNTVTLASTSTFVAQLDGAAATPVAGTDYSQLSGGAGGTIVLNGATIGVLVLDNTQPAVNTVYRVIDDTNGGNASNAVTGTFANLNGMVTDNLGDTYSIAYDSTDSAVDLTVVSDATPEPGSLGLLVLGGVGMLRRRRRAVKA